ncbi:MAG: thermonuclease family protein [Planctomycetota bacterium]
MLHALFALTALSPAPAARPQEPASALTAAHSQPPTELYDVVRVVDGDTLHVQRGERVVKLRLLSVDTEEKLTGRPGNGGSKPETLYGQECADWAVAFFEEQREGDAPARVGLRFPGGVERNDIYGRLLCHVILADGTDFNVMLVETGRSPYFNKYGHSLIAHEAFLAAQAKAKAAGLGIWDPAVNAPKTPGAPSAKRPYEALLPWWQVRAEAVDAFRARAAKDPGRFVAADDPDGLRAAFERCGADPEHRVEIFGSIDRFFDEDDGSWTILFRSGSKRDGVRIAVPKASRAAYAELDLVGRTEEFRQNYLTVTGRLVRGSRGYRLQVESIGDWRVAGAEPELPAPREAAADR